MAVELAFWRPSALTDDEMESFFPDRDGSTARRGSISIRTGRSSNKTGSALSAGAAKSTFLPPASPVDTLHYVIEHPGLKALPPAPETAFEALAESWPIRSAEILGLAENAASADTSIFERLIERLSTVADPATFIGLSSEYPVVRRRLVTENPALLNSADLAALPASELTDLLTLLPDGEELAGIRSIPFSASPALDGSKSVDQL